MNKLTKVDSPEVESGSDGVTPSREGHDGGSSSGTVDPRRVDQIADQLIDDQQRLQLIQSEGRPLPADIGPTIDEVTDTIEEGAARVLEASRMLLRQHGVPETEIR